MAGSTGEDYGNMTCCIVLMKYDKYGCKQQEGNYHMYKILIG